MWAKHLTDDEVTRVIAGLGVVPEAERHLESCVVCRRQVNALAAPIAERRQAQSAEMPDWEAQLDGILARLDAPAATVVRLRRPFWRRTLLAAAAVLVAAVGLWLNVGRKAPATVTTDIHVEQILDQVNATLADDSVPGFEALDSLVPSPGEMAALGSGTTS